MTDLLTTKQVAELKRVTVKTVNVWAAEKKLDVAHEESTGARLYDPAVVASFNPLDPATFSQDYTNQNAAS